MNANSISIILVQLMAFIIICQHCSCQATSTIKESSENACPKLNKSEYNGTINFKFSDSHYLPNTTCKWTITFPLKQYLIAQFTHFNLDYFENDSEINACKLDQDTAEPKYFTDYVRIRYTSITNQSENICFREREQLTSYKNKIVAANGILIVQFKSDAKYEGTGFVLKYHIAKNAFFDSTECPKLINLTKEDGNIRYKYELKNKDELPLHCKQTVIVPEGMIIGVNVKSWNIPMHGTQETDFFQFSGLVETNFIEGPSKQKLSYYGGKSKLVILRLDLLTKKNTKINCCAHAKQFQNESIVFSKRGEDRTFLSYSNTAKIDLKLSNFGIIVNKISFLLEFTAIPTAKHVSQKCTKAVFQNNLRKTKLQTKELGFIMKEFTIRSNISSCLAVEKMSFSKYKVKYNMDDLYEHYIRVILRCKYSNNYLAIYFLDSVVIVKCNSKKEIFRQTDDQFTMKFPDTQEEAYLTVQYVFPQSMITTYPSGTSACPSFDVTKHYKESLNIFLFRKIDRARLLRILPNMKQIRHKNNMIFNCEVALPQKKGHYQKLNFVYSMDKSDVNYMCSKWSRSREIHPQITLYSHFSGLDNKNLSEYNYDYDLCYKNEVGTLQSNKDIIIFPKLNKFDANETENTYVSIMYFGTYQQITNKFSTMFTYEYVPFCPNFKKTRITKNEFTGFLSILPENRYQSCSWNIIPPNDYTYKDFTLKVKISNFYVNCENKNRQVIIIKIINKLNNDQITATQQVQSDHNQTWIARTQQIYICGKGNYTSDTFNKAVTIEYKGILHYGITIQYFFKLNDNLNYSVSDMDKNNNQSAISRQFQTRNSFGITVPIGLSILGLTTLLVIVLFVNRNNLANYCFTIKSQNQILHLKTADTAQIT